MNRNKVFRLAYIVILVLFLGACGSPNKCDRAFDKLLWFQNPDFRHLLVNSLIESEILDSIDRENIFDLLGQPHSSRTKYNAYFLGRPKGRIKVGDPIYFIVEFDTDEMVSSYYINTEPIKNPAR